MGPPGAHWENPQWPLVLLQIPPLHCQGRRWGLAGGWLRAGMAPGFTVSRGYDLFLQRLFNCPCTDAGRQGQGNKGLLTPF